MRQCFRAALQTIKAEKLKMRLLKYSMMVESKNDGGKTEHQFEATNQMFPVDK